MPGEDNRNGMFRSQFSNICGSRLPGRPEDYPEVNGNWQPESWGFVCRSDFPWFATGEIVFLKSVVPLDL